MAMVGFDFDGWENLHSDLLNEIAKKLYSYDDYIRFRCVCKEWNSMLPKIPNHRRDPWLVLPLDFGEESIDSRRVLEEKKIYHVSLPEMKDNFIRGSCHGGWLICVMVSDGKLRILNPFTKAHFDLPPISALPHIVSYEPPNIDGGRGGGQYNLLLDGEIWPMNVVRLHKRVVWKVVISSPPDEEIGEFMAVAIYGGFERLAFCRLNDKRWKDIPTGKPSESCFQDVIFFKEKIFAVDVDAQLYVFDINFGEEQLLPMLKIGGAPPPPPDIHLEHYYTVNKYLIGCDDDGCLLMLVRHLCTIVHDQDEDDGDDYDEDEDDDDEDDIEEDEEIVEEDELQESTYHMISYQFDIYKLNENAIEWSRIHNLGDYVLMIGQNYTTRRSSTLFPEGKKNHIFYSDNQMEMHCLDYPTQQDTGIFNMEDKSNEDLLSDMRFFCPPTWLIIN